MRDDQGMSQETLADRSGFTRQYISMLERQQRMPGYDTVFRLCDGLGVNAVDFTMRVMLRMNQFKRGASTEYPVPTANPLRKVADPGLKRPKNTGR